ncbi:hypothetical protein FQN60_016178 [Etheostoma spectabile]|uniref:Uncharacterized protein n=1 Tax=Etheostoma spectabile TaxID=54343 RepID=A0A5J5D3P0_9PERO|nr:hypothetical protein FQN60_016178 [Etheostoma spectabile]
MLQFETANEPKANQIAALERKVESLSDHIDELENRGRRIFNLPKNMERSSALDFFEHWGPDFLAMDAKVRCVPGQAQTDGSKQSHYIISPRLGDRGMSAVHLGDVGSLHHRQQPGASSESGSRGCVRHRQELDRKVLEFGESAQPIVTLLRLVSFIPVVDVFVPGVVIRQVVHALCDMEMNSSQKEQWSSLVKTYIPNRVLQQSRPGDSDNSHIYEYAMFARAMVKDGTKILVAAVAVVLLLRRLHPAMPRSCYVHLCSALPRYTLLRSAMPCSVLLNPIASCHIHLCSATLHPVTPCSTLL